MLPLLVYESPNKFNAFKNALSGIGVNCDLCYTQGRIFDIPNDRLGIANSRLELKPVDDYRAEFLVANISKASEVLCATDNDAEGEWIASHIKQLCERNRITFSRIRSNTLQLNEFKQAYLDRTTILDSSLISTAISRRLVDRLIGFSDNSDKQLRRGRVLTPSINYINQTTLPTLATIVITNTDDTQVSITCPSNNIRDLERAVNSDIHLFDDTNTKESVDLHNTLDYLKERMLLSNKTVSDAFDELQGMYAKGKVSYIRTENKKYEVLNGEHAGIYALDLEDDSENGQLETIQNRSMLHREPEMYSISSPNLSKELTAICKDLGAVVDKTYKVKRKVASNHLILPPVYLYPTGLKRTPKKLNIQVFEHSKELLLLNVLSELKLGCASTYHSHVLKLDRLTHIKGGQLRLTMQGVRYTLQTDHLSLLLKTPDISVTLNELISNNTLSIEEKNKKCLNILQLNVPETTDFSLEL